MYYRKVDNLLELISDTFHIIELDGLDIGVIEYNITDDILESKLSNSEELEFRTKIYNLLYEHREYTTFTFIKMYYIRSIDGSIIFIPQINIGTEDYTFYKSLIIVGLLGYNITPIIEYEYEIGIEFIEDLYIQLETENDILLNKHLLLFNESRSFLINRDKL